MSKGASYRMAGKTGTAQRVSRNRDSDAPITLREGQKNQALFVGYAPAEAPRIAIAVVVEQGGSGSQSAAPVARKIFDAWLGGAGDSGNGENGNGESGIGNRAEAAPQTIAPESELDEEIRTPAEDSTAPPVEATQPRAATNSPLSRLPIPDSPFPNPAPRFTTPDSPLPIPAAT